MGDEIFSVYLTPADYSKLAYAKLDLPASPWKLLDALDKVRLPEGDSLYLEITDYDRPASLFYLDPPYHATEGYYQNIGEDGFTETDHIRLRDALMRIEGKFLLSYNDDEFIRSLYDRPGIYLMETTRINNIKQRYDNGAQFPELIIANYDMHERLRVAPSQMNLFDLTGGDTAWLKS